MAGRAADLLGLLVGAAGRGAAASPRRRRRGLAQRVVAWRGRFDAAANCTYADRIRRRTPGDATLSLGPHIDGGTAGRWLDPVLRAPYHAVFASDPAAFDPFDATARVAAPATEDANACSAFRTWQGWTALTAQGPGDGTLQVVPLTRAIVWVLLRPFARDVPEASLCGAESARALWISEEWHAPLLRALVPIPRVDPGDAVFWHRDLVHAVEPVHAGRTPSNVMYIPAVPDCPRNRAMLARQRPAFLDGRSPPDFPPDDLEVDFAGRATPGVAERGRATADGAGSARVAAAGAGSGGRKASVRLQQFENPGADGEARAVQLQARRGDTLRDERERPQVSQ